MSGPRFQARFHQQAQRLINSAGTECTYVQVLEGVPNPVTLTVENTTIPTADIKMYIKRPMFKETENPNLVSSTIQQVLLAGTDAPAVPKAGDRVITPTGSLEVLSYFTTWYKGSAAMYTLTCKAM